MFEQVRRSVYKPKEYNGQLAELRFNPQNQNDVLAVSFSSSTRYAFYRMHLPAACLYIADEAGDYYIRDIEGLLDFIRATAKWVGAKKIVLMGISKGAWAALKCAIILSRDFDRTSALAFSPMMQLYPFNENIPFGSYLMLMENAESDCDLHDWLERYGSIEGEFSTDGLELHVYYSARNATDMQEFSLIKGTSVFPHPVQLSVHPCHLPYVCDCGDEKSVRDLVKVAIDKASMTGDLDLANGQDVAIAEMLEMGPQPTAEEIVRGLIQDIRSHS